MKIIVNKEDIINITKKIKGLERLKNRETLLKQISVLMYQSVMRNFKEEGTDKAKWKPLSVYTIARRRKHSNKILQDTGTLRNSIVPVITENTASVGTNLHYAPIHQYGAKIKLPSMLIEPKKARALRFVVDGKVIFSKYAKIPARTIKIPARPFLWLRKDYQERILNLVRNFTKQ